MGFHKNFPRTYSLDAENDFTESTEYYEARETDLGLRFFNAILNSFKIIIRNPFAFPKSQNNLRKFTVDKFPFIILYVVKGSDVIIIAVFHTSRNPKIIKNRI